MSKRHPIVSWDNQKQWFYVELPTDDGNSIKADWGPVLTYIVRIRRVGSEHWSPGFETPFTNCSFSDLQPDTEYEVEIRAKNAAGKGDPSYSRVRTRRRGEGQGLS